MGNTKSSSYTRLLGTDIENSSLAVADGDMVDFLVTYYKPQHYSKYCNEIVAALDPVTTINQYTEHTTELFAKVNLALAADSPSLATHGEYIKQLRSSILSMPYDDSSGYLFRGVDLSAREIDQMESLKSFFIPSFTSTSLDPNKAYAKDSTLVIKVPYGCKYGCSITEQLSRYYAEEKEVLIACYSAYTIEKVEKVNSKRVITLYLDEHLTGLNSLYYTPTAFN